MANPTTPREYRSSTKDKYSQPSHVHMYVMSVTHILLGSSTLKWRSSKLGATGQLCFEFVVALNLRFWTATSPTSRIRRATRFSEHPIPWTLFNSFHILGLPYSESLSMNTRLISMSNASLSILRRLLGRFF